MCPAATVAMSIIAIVSAGVEGARAPTTGLSLRPGGSGTTGGRCLVVVMSLAVAGCPQTIAVRRDYVLLIMRGRAWHMLVDGNAAGSIGTGSAWIPFGAVPFAAVGAGADSVTAGPIIAAVAGGRNDVGVLLNELYVLYNEPGACCGSVSGDPCRRRLAAQFGTGSAPVSLGVACKRRCYSRCIIECGGW